MPPLAIMGWSAYACPCVVGLPMANVCNYPYRFVCYMVDDSCDGIQGSCFEEIVSCSGYYRGSVREGKVKTDANYYIISKVVAVA